MDVRDNAMTSAMSISLQPMPAGLTIFDAPGDNPRLAIAGALDEIGSTAARFRRSNDMLDAMAFLDAIEGLRRFTLVRFSLANSLSEPPYPGAAPRGRALCELLESMIGDVPRLADNCRQQGFSTMERDARRAIASLIFIASLDPRFI